ncbi:MAG: TA system antitoxin ParD family protein [Acidimicrobiales bacterium]
MPSTMPLRIGDDLLASAKLAADATGRSAAQQIGYWAKLGRELERSGSVSVREIAEVLAGARSYDDLDPKAQASVRAEWDARIEARRAALDLAELFTAEGRAWVEAGPDGVTVRHERKGQPVRRVAAAKGTDATPGRKTAKTVPRKGLVKKATAQKKAPIRAR